MTNIDRFFIVLYFVIIIALILDADSSNIDSNALTFKAIQESNQIQIDLTESINQVVSRLEMSGPDETCMAISEFLDSLKKAGNNRNNKFNEGD